MAPRLDPGAAAMSNDLEDTGEIPILTDVVFEGEPGGSSQAAATAILTEVLKLADSLLHQAAKDIEATLFENVYDRLRAQLPEIVDRVLRAHGAHDGTESDRAD